MDLDLENMEVIGVEDVSDGNKEFGGMEEVIKDEVIDMDGLLMVIEPVNEDERVEDFTLLAGNCVKEDVSKLETKVEDSEELTKVDDASVFVWEVSKLVSAICVESREFEEDDDTSPEEISEDDEEWKEEDEMGRMLGVVDEVNKSVVDENGTDWDGEFVDVSDSNWDEAGAVLTTSSDVEACVCELSPTDWVVEDEGIGLVSGFWDGMGLGLGSDVWSEELTVEDSEEGDVEVSCEESKG